MHAATTTDPGTLPGVTNAAGATVNVTATGASTNRNMDATIGAGQTSVVAASLAQTTSQTLWMARWLSPPLAASSWTNAQLAAFTVRVAAAESNTLANQQIQFIAMLWRAGAKVAGADLAGNTASPTGVTAETGFTVTLANSVPASWTVLANDILVVEAFCFQTQGMATSYNDTLWYDGTTENLASNYATYITFNGVDLPLAGAAAATARPTQRVVGQAVQRAATRCWTRRRSGIVVPRLWLPAGAAA